jgi:hypothetical protein
VDGRPRSARVRPAGSQNPYQSQGSGRRSRNLLEPPQLRRRDGPQRIP